MFAAAAGGAISGAIIGAVHGGLEGALKGAAIGFALGATMGGFIGAFGKGFGIAAAIGGAAYAGVAGGAEGLGDFAAGMAGGMIGTYVGQAMVGSSTVQSSTSETTTQGQTETDVVLEENLNDGNVVGAGDGAVATSPKPSAQATLDAATGTAQRAQSGMVGRGNNPTPASTTSDLSWDEAWTEAGQGWRDLGGDFAKSLTVTPEAIELSLNPSLSIPKVTITPAQAWEDLKFVAKVSLNFLPIGGGLVRRIVVGAIFNYLVHAADPSSAY